MIARCIASGSGTGIKTARHGPGGLSGPSLADWEPDLEESSGVFDGWRCNRYRIRVLYDLDVIRRCLNAQMA